MVLDAIFKFHFVFVANIKVETDFLYIDFVSWDLAEFIRFPVCTCLFLLDPFGFLYTIISKETTYFLLVFQTLFPLIHWLEPLIWC